MLGCHFRHVLKPETTKRNDRNERNRNKLSETTETTETTEMSKMVSNKWKKFKKRRQPCFCYGSLISHPDPPVCHRDITNSRRACKDWWTQARRAIEKKVGIFHILNAVLAKTKNLIFKTKKESWSYRGFVCGGEWSFIEKDFKSDLL